MLSTGRSDSACWDLLVDANADIFAKGRLNGRTTLMSAAEYGNGNYVEALVAAKADVNHQDADGNTALMLAALQFDYPASWLQAAAAHERIQLVRMLVDAKADINARNKNNDTALILALSKRSIPVCNCLSTPKQILMSNLILTAQLL